MDWRFGGAAATRSHWEKSACPPPPHSPGPPSTPPEAGMRAGREGAEREASWIARLSRDSFSHQLRHLRVKERKAPIRRLAPGAPPAASGGRSSRTPATAAAFQEGEERESARETEREKLAVRDSRFWRAQKNDFLAGKITPQVWHAPISWKNVLSVRVGGASDWSEADFGARLISLASTNRLFKTEIFRPQQKAPKRPFPDRENRKFCGVFCEISEADDSLLA